jgi:hypothetical protein
MKRVIVVGTDHRIQQSIAQDATKTTWVPRTSPRFSKLIICCLRDSGAKVILEEVLPEQEKVAPTICSAIAKERGIAWEPVALGTPDLSQGFFDPPLQEAILRNIKPELLAGRYDLNLQRVREDFMFDTTMNYLEQHECALVVVGFVHLGVLARRFEAAKCRVEALVFTPFLIDQIKA